MQLLLLFNAFLAEHGNITVITFNIEVHIFPISYKHGWKEQTGLLMHIMKYSSVLGLRVFLFITANHYKSVRTRWQLYNPSWT